MPSPRPVIKNSPWTKEARRKKNVVVTSIALDLEARELLLEMASPKSFGAFVSGLILAEKARREERQRVRRRRAAAQEN